MATRRIIIPVCVTCFALLGLLWIWPIAVLVCNQPSKLERQQRVALWEDIDKQFPDAAVFLGPPYGPPHRWNITLVVVGVRESEKQTDIKDWLTQYKTEKGIRCEMKLKFYERHIHNEERAIGTIPAVDWADVENLLADYDL